jgi:alpha-galactosidase
MGFTHDIQFVNVLRNLDHDAADPRAAGPGHWNDPDYLGPELGMTGAEALAQFSMWAILAAPLILGSDPRALSPATITMLENREVIEVDQDRLGIQGTMIRRQDDGQVWRKRLAGGACAVALLNRGTRPLRITIAAQGLGLARAGTYAVRDLWAHRTTMTSGTVGALVAPHSARLYRVQPQ